MTMLKSLITAAAMAGCALLSTAAAAVPITYTLTGSFTGTLGGNPFTDYKATFTGIGDTANFSTHDDANFVSLTSLKIAGTAPNENFDLGAGYSFWASTSYSSAGFKLGNADVFALSGSQFATFTNTSSLAAGSVTQLATAPFTANGTPAIIDSSSDLVFSAMVSAAPEPSTWAMMIFGFGMAGAGLRRKARQSEDKFTKKIREMASA